MIKHYIVNDNVHGHFDLSPIALKIINTSEFQRLRYIKQLGLTYFVYPTAEHTRFVHSLGAYHLTRRQMKHLQNLQPELNITDHIVELVSIAGLCHDIGHTCFSHAFEHWTKQKGFNFEHEYMSVKLVERIFDKYLKDDLTQEDMEFVINCIKPTYDVDNYLFQIICNKTGLDTDKYDYIHRDALNCNKPVSFKSNPLIMNSRVIGNELCYRDKECYNTYELFRNRFSMHKQVYTHKVSLGIELMMMDYLDEVHKKLDITTFINDLDKYITLTDHIFPRYDISNEANNIINRIFTRDIYKFTYQIIDNDKEIIGNFIDNFRKHIPEDLMKNIRIITGKIDYGMNDKNPIDQVKFFNPSNPNKSFHIDKSQVSILLPEKFIEYYVRIYVTYSKHSNNSDNKIKEIHKIINICQKID